MIPQRATPSSVHRILAEHAQTVRLLQEYSDTVDEDDLDVEMVASGLLAV